MGDLTLACLARSPDAECVGDAILAVVGLVTLAYTLNVVREQVGLDASRWQRMTMGFVCLGARLGGGQRVGAGGPLTPVMAPGQTRCCSWRAPPCTETSA